jgi:hypothetical protein
MCAYWKFRHPSFFKPRLVLYLDKRESFNFQEMVFSAPRSSHWLPYPWNGLKARSEKKQKTHSYGKERLGEGAKYRHAGSVWLVQPYPKGQSLRFSGFSMEAFRSGRRRPEGIGRIAVRCYYRARPTLPESVRPESSQLVLSDVGLGLHPRWIGIGR